MCGLELTMQRGQLTGVRGDAADPFSRGHVCAKAAALIDLESDPQRLRVPHLRDGERWNPISWEEALALAGTRLATIQHQYGNDAVGVYLGNPNVHHLGLIAYLPHLLRSLRTRNVFSASTVDQMPHQVVMRAMYGHQFRIPIPDIDRTDCCLMLGANPMASNGSLMTAPDIAQRLRALVQRGALIVVDPRRTETAAVATLHVSIQPGADAWLLMALLDQLAELERWRQYGPALHGFADALAAVRACLKGVTVTDVTGVASTTIAAIVQHLKTARAPVVYGRMGVSTQAFGTLCQWLIQLLNIALGQLDREGGAMVNTPAWPLAPGAASRDRWKSRVRGSPEVAGELPSVCLAEEIDTPGAGQIRGMLISAGNPVLSVPGGPRLEAALGSLEFMVAIDPYINETTRMAHLILPPTSHLHQVDYDLFFSAFAIRRVARVNQPVAPPPPDERADWEIICGLGKQYARASEKTWPELPEPERMIDQGLRTGTTGLTFTSLQQAVHGLDLGPLVPGLLAQLATENRGIDCAPEIILNDLPRLSQHRQAVRPSLVLIGRRHIRSNNSWMHFSRRLTKGPTRHELWMHPDDLIARKLAHGATVEVRSRSGRIVTTVLASSDMRPGVASLPHGFGHQRSGVRTGAVNIVGASYNDLTSIDAVDELSGNAAVNGIAIDVLPVTPVAASI
jgi:anaerobic selenocysteine-containing dehydrogenase